MTLFGAMAGSALLVVGYTYVGYPLAIGLLAKLRPQPQATRDEAFEPTVTACISAYNAETYIGAKIESLLAQRYPAEKIEILVYSDGSTDGTDAEVLRLAERAPGRIKLIRGERRLGKPTALNTMASMAQGEVLLMTDARQQLTPGALRALVSELAPDDVGCVSGNLMLEGSAGAGAYWRYEKWLRRQEARFRSMVGVTGAIYVIRKYDLAPLPEGLILDDMWIPMRLRLRDKRILWCDEAVAFDQAFDDEREFGRKVRTLAGNFQLFSLLPDLLDPVTNPSWFETISHKVMRLACPWALATLLVSSAGIALSSAALSAPAALAAKGLLAGQLVFYGLAAAGGRAGKPGKLARTFVVMNAAALVGALRWARGDQTVTW